MSVHAPAPPRAPDPTAPADADERLCALRSLSHYREGYPCQPHHEYAETFTTDPYYSEEDVAIWPTGSPHSRCLVHLCSAFRALLAWLLQHVSQDVPIVNIPGYLLASAPRHTGSQSPDLAVWPFPEPKMHELSTYDFQVHGPPLLTLEVVSHAKSETIRNDWHVKFQNYACMGVGEYWVLDTQKAQPLQGFRWTVVDDPAWPVVHAPAPPKIADEDNVWPPVAYAPVPGQPHAWRAVVYAALPAVDDGWRSAVLDAALRWDAERLALQRRDDRGHWLDVYVPPDVAEARGEAKGRREGRQERDVEQLVAMVRDYGALSPAQLDAYRARLETLPPAALPDAMGSLARLLAFPTAAARERAVQAFVKTGRMPR